MMWKLGIDDANQMRVIAPEEAVYVLGLETRWRIEVKGIAYKCEHFLCI